MAKAKAEGRGRRPVLAADDLALWEHVARGARPLPRRPKPAALSPPAAPGAVREERKSAAALAPPTAPRAVPLPALSHDAAPGLDARSAERLRRGAMGIEARLDLHGFTQEEAHRALIAFVERAWRQRLRALLVITGKGGRGEESGILRQAVPRWLNEAPLRARLLAFARAQPKDGGSGALYILLRRQR